MTLRDAPLERTPHDRPLDDASTPPWLLEGAVAGAVGAAVIAVFFLIVDLLEGRPLWTPSALGSVFFLGERAAPDAPAVPALVAGWTFVHGAVFVGLGIMAAFEIFTGGRVPRLRAPARMLLLGIVLFAVLEVVFVIFGLVMAPSVLQVLGYGRVAAANALAAAFMALHLVRRAEHYGVGAPAAARDPG